MTWKLGSKVGEQTLIGVVRGSDVKGEYVTQVGGREPVAKAVPPKSAKVREPVAKTASLKSTK